MPVKALQATEDRYALLSQTSRLRDFKTALTAPFLTHPLFPDQCRKRGVFLNKQQGLSHSKTIKSAVGTKPR